MLGSPGLFVSRADELGGMLGALEHGFAGIVVSGPAGVGKTRLVAEFLRHAAERGFPTRTVTASRSLSAVPLGAFASLLPADDRPPAAPSELLGKALAALRAAGSRPLVLGIDDAHMLDDLSAGLVQLLVSTRTAVVAAAVRTGEREPDGVAALWRDDRVVRVGLRPLDRTGADLLVQSVVGGHVDGPTLQRLWDTGRGSPLFIRELLAVGRERGALIQRGGIWSWAGRLMIEGRLSQLLAERLEGLDDVERTTLELIAVGEPIGPELLRHHADDAVLLRLEARGLITSGFEDRRHEIRMAHPLYAEGLRLGIPPLRRRSIYRALAGALASTGARRKDDIIRLTLWQLEAGVARDSGRLIAAARHALAMFDHALAERLARSAERLAPDVRVALTLAESMHWTGRHREARSVLDGYDQAGIAADELAEYAIVSADNFLFGYGDADSARRVMRTAQQRLTDAQGRFRVAAHRALHEFSLGDPAESVRIADDVLASGTDDPEARIRALFIHMPGLAVIGRIDDGLRAAATAQRIADEAELPPLVAANIAGAQVVALRFAGRLDDADAVGGDSERLQNPGLRGNDGWWPLILGQVALDRGQIGRATRLFQEAAALLATDDVNRIRLWALTGLATAQSIAGNHNDARRALDTAERYRSAPNRWLEAEVLRATAWVAAAEGNLSGARQLARAAATDASAKGQTVFELLALHDALRLGDHGVASRISRVAGGVDGAVARAVAAHAAAVAQQDPQAIRRAAARFAEIGMLLIAAETECAAAELLRSRPDQADQLKAGKVATEAANLLARCEGARTPALAGLVGAHPLAPLTVRERELAVLAARLSSREIATRLTLSVRTVDNHLARVYQKLGISGRADLAMLLGTEHE